MPTSEYSLDEFTLSSNFVMARGAIVAIDPGAVRTGVAVRAIDGQIHCLSGSPSVVKLWFRSVLAGVELVVLEKWVSYPGKAAANAWRDLAEVKLLGVLEDICEQNGWPYIYQPTRLLAGTQAAADAAGYQWRARNRDEKAAETHLYYYLYLSNREEDS